MEVARKMQEIRPFKENLGELFQKSYSAWKSLGKGEEPEKRKGPGEGQGMRFYGIAGGKRD